MSACGWRGQDGSRHCQSAFTLIEILAVVAITGIILLVASLNLFPSDEQLSRRDAATVALAVERARDAAWFGGVPTAISFEEGRVKPWRLAGSAWEPVAREESVPGLRIVSMQLDGQPLEAGSRLVFLADGLGIPFSVRLETRGRAWAVQGDAAGSVRLVAP
jgi:type II secretion system protein H